MFEIDYEKALEFGNIVDGVYEVTIEHSMEKTTPNGADYLDIPLRIRTDFDQPHKNSQFSKWNFIDDFKCVMYMNFSNDWLTT